MNILFVAQNAFYPEINHGGGQDLWHLVERLYKHGHHIYVAAFEDPRIPIPRQTLAPYVERLETIHYALTLITKCWMMSRAIYQGYRFGSRRREWEMMRAIQRLCEQHSIDVLHCAWTESGRYLHVSERPKLRVLDEVDVRFAVDDAIVQQGRLSIKMAAQRKAEELGYCRTADLILTRSMVDLTLLKTHIPTLHGYVLPPVGNIDRLITITADDVRSDNVLFCGAMDRGANIEAALWLVQQVWPLVRTQVPIATLHIVGANPPHQIQRFHGRDGIEVSGTVPDLVPYYRRARVVVAPNHTPAGSLNKIIDGLAAGRPVVATSTANRGTQAECVLIHDEPQSFAQAIANLLKNDVEWQKAAQSSRAFAQTHFNWSAHADQLEAIYREKTLTLRYLN